MANYLAVSPCLEEKYLGKYETAAIVRRDETAAALLGWRLVGRIELVTDCGTAPMLVVG